MTQAVSECIVAEKPVIQGNPYIKAVLTSYVERQKDGLPA